MASKRPDYQVTTPSLDGKRLATIGAAWDTVSKDGKPYIAISLDVYPTSGRLMLWRNNDQGRPDREAVLGDFEVPPPGDQDVPFR